MENGEEEVPWKEALRQVADFGYWGPKERAACRCAMSRFGAALRSGSKSISRLAF